MSLKLQKGESIELEKIRQKDSQLREYLQAKSITATSSPLDHLIYIQNLANLLGNVKNQASAAACILAREYMSEKCGAKEFDSCSKAQGARGIDIDCQTSDGKRIIGEVKTTLPYGGTTLGAKQAEQFQKDLVRLAETSADQKFFFVLNDESKKAAEKVVKNRNYDSTIKIINLLAL